MQSQAVGERIRAVAIAIRVAIGAIDEIATFLRAARLGIFELSWNVLCPGCGGVVNLITRG